MRKRVIWAVALVTVLNVNGFDAWADPVAGTEQPPPADAETNETVAPTNSSPVVQPLSRARGRPARVGRFAPVASSPPKPVIKTESKPAITLESLEKQRDIALRKEAADRLEALGFRQFWEVFTLDELLDKENRIKLANQLREQGIDMSWASHSYSDLLDVEKRLIRSQRLRLMGKVVDWKRYSAEQLDQMEIDLCQRQARR